ncbi:MAG: hypothetical protein GWO24_27130, partial [Akkermansiaceae bacterium]|nr:hypothetical protein [Akkermansiaceae bacterium]
AWTGDEVGYRLRPERYTSHLKRLLEAWPASHVLIHGFGWSEAFAGKAGLEGFTSSLRTYLHEIRRRHPDAGIVLMLPANQPREMAGTLPGQPAPHLRAYAAAMKQTAAEAGV